MVLDMLRSGSMLSGNSFSEMRANMEAATTSLPLPADVAYEAVDAGGVPAEWAVAPGVRSDRVIVYFHGGGYCIGSIKTHRLLVAELSRACAARVLSVDYRLAPEDPHPAAVDDAVAAYNFVRSAGVTAPHIALAGDSAGGGLVAATLIALRDAGTALPAAGVCLSPWVDLTMAGASMTSKAAADPMVQREHLEKYARAYAGRNCTAPTVSPLFADLRGLSPLLLHVGTAETLLDDSTRFAERLTAAGVSVELRVFDEMIHVWHAFSFILPEARAAIEEIGAFVRQRLGA